MSGTNGANSHTKWRSGFWTRELLYTIGDRTVSVRFDQAQDRRGLGKIPAWDARICTTGRGLKRKLECLNHS